jgi:predicted oxidoreductase
MKTTFLGSSSLAGSRLAYGCWRIAGSWDPAEVSADSRARGRQAVLTAVESGFTVFDLADIYCDGEAEKLFGQVLKEVSGLREKVILCTKCGIRKPGDPKPSSPHRYDFSVDYIVRSCEGSLRRLGVECIDVYQLHRPDYLMDPEEVASAFGRLRQEGKAREFGVSNFRPTQLDALRRACPMPLVVHQVEISLAQLDRFEDGTLDQCLARRITPMAWSPLGAGTLGDGPRKLLPSQEGYRTDEVTAALDLVAKSHSVPRIAVALAWLLRHPARIMPILGSTNPANIRAAAKADGMDLSREEWYQLLRAARGQPLP